jgi:hypothetical protein
LATYEVRLQSDATKVDGKGTCILMHVLSDALTWGLGFTQAIEARWPRQSLGIERRLRALKRRPALGEVLFSNIDSMVEIAHLIVEPSSGSRTLGLDLNAFRVSLGVVARRALATKATVHAPPLGTGLASANFEDVSFIVQSELVVRGIDVVIHSLGSEPVGRGYATATVLR